MRDLLRFDWSQYDAPSGFKAAVAAAAMFALEQLSGETWVATGLVLMLVTCLVSSDQRFLEDGLLRVRC